MNGTQDAENVISELRSSLEQVVKERYGINYSFSQSHVTKERPMQTLNLFVCDSLCTSYMYVRGGY